MLLCAQRDPRVDEPDGDGLYRTGTVAVLREVRADGAGTVRIIAEGLARAEVRAFRLGEPLVPAAGTSPVGAGASVTSPRRPEPGRDARRAAGGSSARLGRGAPRASVPVQPLPGAGPSPSEHGDAVCLLADADILADDGQAASDDPEVAQLARAVFDRYHRWLEAAGRASVGSGASPLPSLTEPGRLADAVASRVLQRSDDRQRILQTRSVRERLQLLQRMLIRETEQSQVEQDVRTRVRRQLDRTQREYYLREQMKAIQQELGEMDGPQSEHEDLRQRLRTAALPPVVQERASRELDRLEKMPAMAAEAVVVRGYLDWLLALPWAHAAADNLDLAAVERVLDEDHDGLRTVKERVLEFLALRLLRGHARGPVLCLVGPPGAGKTSLARSIARATGRPFVRISLGGVRDEAEIRGHRRTYVGALPGRILHGLRQAGERNPVMLLDEIDKMSADFRGDPAAALLEVLDPEQNAAFSDHYLEVPFDLSEVMFITTANSLHPLNRPLLDRLEVIELSGYTEDEKVRIAKRFLVPRQIRDSGLEKTGLRVSDAALRQIVDRYTREAGVRGLERQVATICRKVAREVVRQPRSAVTVSTRNLHRYLGQPRLFRQGLPEHDEVGLAVGLAWTESGGDVLLLEASVLPGRGSVQLTGKLGDVMRESAHAALSYLRGRSAAFGLAPDFLERCELHVHAPEGAVPKEGPSAGVALATAMLSALSGVAVRRDVALTGEITLRGRVLPVGGIKEKVLAARRAGARSVILPAANRGDWDELLATTDPGLVPVFVEHVDEALAAALVGGLPHAGDDAPPPLAMRCSTGGRSAVVGAAVVGTA